MMLSSRHELTRRRNTAHRVVAPLCVFLLTLLGMLLVRMWPEATPWTYARTLIELDLSMVPVVKPPAQTTEMYIRKFVEAAKADTPTTDKVTDHSYFTMYSRFLLPFYERKENMRMIEIGLGCDMKYGPGASVKLWKKIFPQAEIWEAESRAACVEKASAEGQLKGIHVLVGDQGDSNVLNRWVEETGGGHFDVVIDDGGHKNIQIKRTFEKFWPLLNAGGLYFIEDMQVGKRPVNMMGADGVMSDAVQDWIEQLVYSGKDVEVQRRPIMYKLPADIAFATCQRHACVIGKLTQMEKASLQ